MPVCIAVMNPAFQPAMRIITNITGGNPLTITTSFAHQYISGTIVRLDIPLTNGMQAVAGIQYPITVTGSTTFTIPTGPGNSMPYSNINCAMVVPVGENSDMLTAATQNVLPYRAT